MTNNNTTYREKGRAMFLAAVMVISVVAMSAAFAGSAAAQVTDATRTIEDTTLAPGESTSVTVDVQLDSQGDPDVLEEFDPAFASVSLESATPFPTVQETRQGNTEYLVVWEGTDTATVTYNVTVPQNANDGDTFSISGNASDADGSVSISGDSTITIQENQSQPDFQITSVTPEGANSSIEQGESQDYVVNVENQGDASGTQNVAVDVGSLQASKSLQLDAGESGEVTLSPSVSSLGVGSYPVTVKTNNDQVKGQLDVTSFEDGNVIDGSIFDTQQQPISNAGEVRVTLTDSSGTTYIDNVTMANLEEGSVENDDISTEVLAANYVDNGDNAVDQYNIRIARTPGTGEVTYQLSTELPGFDTFDGSAGIVLSPGEGEEQNIRVRRIAEADELTVQPGDTTVDVEDTVDATVTVESFDQAEPFDELGPFPNEDVSADVISIDDPNGVFTTTADVEVTPTDNTTESDGTTDFSVELDLTGVDLDNLDANIDTAVEFDAESSDASDILNVTFEAEPPSGDGHISGNVEEITPNAVSNTQPADGVGVHAVNVDRVDANTYEFYPSDGAAEPVAWPTVDAAGPLSAPGEGSDYDNYYKVAELDDTGSVDQVLDVRTDYLVGSTGADISQNTSIAGTGFSASSNNFVVAPLEPGDYQVQYSPDGSFDTPTTVDFSVSENLTYEFTEQRYANSPAVHTDVTTDDGRYELYNLFTDGNAGQDYVVIAADDTPDLGFANMRGYDTVNAEQNANPEQLETDLTVFETDVIPDTITGENLGQIPSASDADAEYEADLDTDDPNEIERNGKMVDVIEINTSVDGNPIGTEATVEIGPTSGTFNGEFLDTAVEGDVVSHSSDSITVDTSPSTEGTAVVFLETDSDSNDVFVQIEAALENGLDEVEIGGDVDPSDDFDPGKRFIGVDTYDSGSLKGDIARDDDALTDTFVWVRELTDTAGNTIRINPDFAGTSGVSGFSDLSSDSDVKSLNFTVEFDDSATQGVDSTFTATGDELRGIDLADRIGPIAAPNVADFNLLRFANPLSADNPGQYSMDRVPAQPGGVDYGLIEARQYDTAENGTTDARGGRSVTPGLTRNGDITIPGALVNSSYDLSNLNPADATVDQGSDNITVSADLDNTGLDDGEQDVTLEVTNASGDVVYSDTQTDVVVDAGASTTVEFSDVPAGDLSPGDYTHTIATEDDSISGSLTVNETQNGGSDVPSWATSYVDDDGVATLTGASDAISDFSDGDLGLIRASNIIESYNTQTPIQDIVSE